MYPRLHLINSREDNKHTSRRGGVQHSSRRLQQHQLVEMPNLETRRPVLGVVCTSPSFSTNIHGEKNKTRHLLWTRYYTNSCHAEQLFYDSSNHQSYNRMIEQQCLVHTCVSEPSIEVELNTPRLSRVRAARMHGGHGDDATSSGGESEGLDRAGGAGDAGSGGDVDSKRMRRLELNRKVRCACPTASVM